MLHHINLIPIGNFISNVRSSIRFALKYAKTNYIIEHLGIDAHEYKLYIEKQFEDGMTWKNHGLWHIDHVIPLKYEENGVPPTMEEIVKRLYYTNTQPLWKQHNLSKSNRRTGR